MAKKTTSAMDEALKWLLEKERGNIHFMYRILGTRGNPSWGTACALERRGLAEYRYDRARGTGTFFLTPEGREAATQGAY